MTVRPIRSNFISERMERVARFSGYAAEYAAKLSTVAAIPEKDYGFIVFEECLFLTKTTATGYKLIEFNNATVFIHRDYAEHACEAWNQATGRFKACVYTYEEGRHKLMLAYKKAIDMHMLNVSKYLST